MASPHSKQLITRGFGIVHQYQIYESMFSSVVETFQFLCRKTETGNFYPIE